MTGEKSLSLVLPIKIEDVKSKGFLEGKKRISQGGFPHHSTI
jgi:hypothetical protein